MRSIVSFHIFVFSAFSQYFVLSEETTQYPITQLDLLDSSSDTSLDFFSILHDSSREKKEIERPISGILQENLSSEPKEKYSFSAHQRKLPSLGSYKQRQYHPVLNPMLENYGQSIEQPRNKYALAFPAPVEVKYLPNSSIPEGGDFSQFNLPSEREEYRFSSDTEKPTEDFMPFIIEGEYYNLTSSTSSQSNGEETQSTDVTKQEKTVTGEELAESTTLSDEKFSRVKKRDNIPLLGTTHRERISLDDLVKRLGRRKFTGEVELSDSYISESPITGRKSYIGYSEKKHHTPQNPTNFPQTISDSTNIHELDSKESTENENEKLENSIKIYNCWATGAEGGNFAKDEWCRMSCSDEGVCPGNSSVRCQCNLLRYI